MSKYYVTTPIYYVNSRPHLGHAYTTLAADVLARYHRLKGDKVWFLTGTDEHGAKIAAAAAAAHQAPKEFVDEISKLYRAAWDQLQISYDQFIRTTDPEHEQSVKLFIKKLQTSGAIYSGEYKGLYCVGCEKFITPADLVDGKCPDHGTVPQELKEQNYFFKLSEYLPRVKDLIERDEIKILPLEKKNEALGLIAQELADFSISRASVQWGIPMPGDPKQVIYVWVDALLNYISAIGYGRDDELFKTWWPANLHLLAKDIIKFHTIYWPALLLAAGEKLPRTLFVHGYFTVNGAKMSKTRGNVIDVGEMINKYGVDATRYLLLSAFSFEKGGDIRAEQFIEKYNADLANNLGNLVSRVSQMVEKYFDGELPEVDIEIEYDLEKVNHAIENFQFDKAIQEIQAIISKANQLIEEEKPWEIAETKNMDKLAKLLTQLTITIKEVALVIEPFMPTVAKKIHKQFNQKRIVKAEPLFPRIYQQPPARPYRKFNN